MLFIFIILTILFYALVTALTGIYLPMFMFIPLSIAILMGLKYSKVQAVLATVGASTMGLIGQISNSIINQVAELDKNTYIWVKVGLLVVLVLLTILYTIKIKVKKEKVETKEETIMFTPSKRNAEIDFVLYSQEDGIIPIEVKSGNNIKSVSLNMYINEYNPKYAIRFSTRNFGFENNIKSIPLYAVFCIK